MFKKILLTCCLCISLFGDISNDLEEFESSTLKEQLEQLKEENDKNQEIIDRLYFEKFTELLLEANHVELFLLDPKIKEGKISEDDSIEDLDSEKKFAIYPYGKFTKIVKKKKLTKKEVKEFLPLLYTAMRTDEGQNDCHKPIHGVRIYSGNSIIFQSSFCYDCSNYYFVYPSGEAEWRSFGGARFRKFIEQYLPIPKRKKKIKK